MQSLDRISVTRKTMESYSTAILIQLLYECEIDNKVWTNNPHFEMLTDLVSQCSKLQLNCAYIDMFDDKVYNPQVWNTSFNPWCRGRLNLHQPDLVYNADGTRAGDRSEQFHQRARP